MNPKVIRADRENRKDVWEHRSIPMFDLRSESSGGSLRLTGYASTFEPYEMYGGPANGGWIEQLDRGAFNATLREDPDVHLLINHEGMPLARTKSGTLQLSVDRTGLLTDSLLDPLDPDVQRLAPKMRRKDMDEMSFAFRVKDQEWKSTPEFPDDEYAYRCITEVSLHKGDVSVVNFGANPTTSAELKSVDEALAMLAECDPRQLAEARSGQEILRRARAALDKVGAVNERVRTAAEAMRLAQSAAAGAAAAAEINERFRAQRAEAASNAPRGMSLREALARQGYASDDGKSFTLDEALAQIGK
ncbi:phage prohead protease, HK97 family [Mycobacteroides abscessus subsp. massiliense]|uniref:HK97 family phage prohead protease n=1 Tax=Mycobacteroides TaxID=670516 RepID=UPI0009A8FCAA|nr:MULTISPECIES: HK97 family phage prohead protease [Mycobacteroides]SLC04223.1 phage prohead protease, HK97 family [Mycobacteroides abscessus subsp. massiliense]